MLGLDQPVLPLSQSTTRHGRGLFLLITAMLLSAIAFFAAWVTPASRSEPRVPQFTQLTNDGRPKSGPLLTDGRQLFFNEVFNGINQIASVPVSGGDPQPLSSELAGMLLQDISPTRRLLLVRSLSLVRPVFSTYSLADRRLRKVAVGDGAGTWDHTGDALTFSSNTSLLSLHLLEASERRFLDLPGHPDYLRWSPDGTRLRMTLRDSGGGPVGTWEFDKRRSVARKLDEMSKAGEWASHGVWSPDGKYFLFEAGDDHRQNLWITKEKRALGRAEATRLTDGPASWTWPAFAKDNSQILAVHDERRSELSFFDPIRGEWRSAWRGLPAYELHYSRDGQWVAFIYQPNHTLWKARPDGSGPVQLTWPTFVAHQPHWSPDGRSIAFMGQNPNGPWQVFVIPAHGGRAKELLPIADNEGVPTWSLDGKQVLFGELLGRKQLSVMCLHAIDIPTRRAREIPGTRGLWSPRWSPDGKSILAVTTDNKSVRIASPDWTHSFELVRMFSVDNVMWSYDSKYIYFDGRLQLDDAQDLYRISTGTKRLERLVAMRDFVRPTENWYGVSSGGNPACLQRIRGAGTFRAEVSVAVKHFLCACQRSIYCSPAPLFAASNPPKI